ncbi:carboxymuconolactone decarboxylase family protein [Pseudoalteromonas rubra]|uniref:Carboxymuconolactone decarboxylase family protein n=1 Tax=Pseudoalteromonas rubra TaxID=43658 RepID=A0A5S3UT37_9GAMM|nr:carboxymuconolactone decarboxylase family protein [Pseudoalteromonas rubra]MEC4089606.1 carboxymuconolactone decarboxylase family protein [Pseudoalteromonas rubra]QPB82771.1 carboxymuconolactone decarboxylase family protein [Pseudoalteromonas rubra]
MFTYYEPDTAPQDSKPLMAQSLASFGMLPNLHKVLAESAVTYKAYNDTFNAFMQDTSLSAVEQQVVFMTANYENNCHYCVPGHTWMMKSAGMPDDLISALREGTPLPDSKLQALQDFVKALLAKQGHIGDDALAAFLSAGYSKQQALEVLTGLAAKLISNFTNALAKTELDPPMQAYQWTHPDSR